MKRKSIFLILLIAFVVSMSIVAAINVNIALPVKSVYSNLTLKNIEAYTVEGERGAIILRTCDASVYIHPEGISLRQCADGTTLNRLYPCHNVIGFPPVMVLMQCYTPGN